MKKIISVICLGFVFNSLSSPICTYGIALSDNQSPTISEINKEQYYYEENGVYYGIDDCQWNEPATAGTCELSELLDTLCTQNPDGKFAVKFQYRTSDGIFPNLPGGSEIFRLNQEGIKARIAIIDGFVIAYAVMDAEQLNRFPADIKFGYKMALSENLYNTSNIISEQTADSILERRKDKYYLSSDGVYYAESGYDELYNEAEEKYFPPAGTYDIAETLLSLRVKYPDNKYAVQIKYPIVSEDEISRLRENGISAERMDDDECKLYAVMTSEQIKYFPTAENTRCILGLSEIEFKRAYSPVLLSGDINSDGKVDVTDLSELSLALVDNTKLNEAQQKAVDVDGDGSVKLTDLATLKQYISKQIDSL